MVSALSAFLLPFTERPPGKGCIEYLDFDSSVAESSHARVRQDKRGCIYIRRDKSHIEGCDNPVRSYFRSER